MGGQFWVLWVIINIIFPVLSVLGGQNIMFRVLSGIRSQWHYFSGSEF